MVSILRCGMYDVFCAEKCDRRQTAEVEETITFKVLTLPLLIMLSWNCLHFNHFLAYPLLLLIIEIFHFRWRNFWLIQNRDIFSFYYGSVNVISLKLGTSRFENFIAINFIIFYRQCHSANATCVTLVKSVIFFYQNLVVKSAQYWSWICLNVF